MSCPRAPCMPSLVQYVPYCGYSDAPSSFPLTFIAGTWAVWKPCDGCLCSLSKRNACAELNLRPAGVGRARAIPHHLQHGQPFSGTVLWARRKHGVDHRQVSPWCKGGWHVPSAAATRRRNPAPALLTASAGLATKR